MALLDLSSTQYLQSYYALLGLSWATDFITEQSNLNPELAPMRYLSSISLALIVLMALACTATPAKKAATGLDKPFSFSDDIDSQQEAMAIYLAYQRQHPVMHNWGDRVGGSTAGA